MVRVAGKPILGHILDGFQETRIDEVVVVVGVMREHVEESVGANYSDSFDVTFVKQSQTEGLGHCIYQARDAFGTDSMCIALGDMLFDSGYGEFLAAYDSMRDLDASIDDGATIEDSRIRNGIVGRGASLTDVNLSETIVGEESSVEGSPTHRILVS